MIQFGAEITPERHSMPRRPPRRQEHIHQKGDSQDASGSYPKSEQQRKANEQFDDSDDITKENRMGQDEARQNRPVETDDTIRHVVLQISLESAVSERRP